MLSDEVYTKANELYIAQYISFEELLGVLHETITLEQLEKEKLWK